LFVSCFKQQQADLANPVTSLPHYVDGDSIRNTDLVVWVNAGG
jgi:hypothetical protein